MELGDGLDDGVDSDKVVATGTIRTMSNFLFDAVAGSIVRANQVRITAFSLKGRTLFSNGVNCRGILVCLVLTKRYFISCCWLYSFVAVCFSFTFEPRPCVAEMGTI